MIHLSFLCNTFGMDKGTDLTAIQEKIHIIRGKKVMLDRDLAMLYGVETRILNQAVRRNLRRFPVDFMFQLNSEEIGLYSMSQSTILMNQVKDGKFLRSQFVISKRGGNRYAPFAFTEQGVAMLSSVLNSEKAIAVNIQIIRVFTKLREMIDQYKELREQVEEMEKTNKENFEEIFNVIKRLIIEKSEPKENIGFNLN
jgi:ORF6N domain